MRLIKGEPSARDFARLRVDLSDDDRRRLERLMLLPMPAPAKEERHDA